MKKKVCLIYNFAQHYRTSIFTLLDRNYDCDFIFGNNYLDVKKFDYSLLNNVNEVANIDFHGFKWQKGTLKYAFKKYDAYILIGEPAILSVWFIMLICKCLGKSVYLWTHGWYGKENKAKVLIKKAFYGLSTGVLLYGTYAKKLMIQAGIPEKKLHVIYNSLDYDSQLKQRAKIKPEQIYQDHFKNENKNLIFIGRLTKVKKLDLIIDAMVLAKQNGHSYNCTFIGDGEEKEALESKVKACGLSDSVWFYGACYAEDELARLIYNADLCISPGNVGLTAMHSLVYGCPIITHDNFPYQMPEFEAIVPNKTGMYFKYNDINSLCQTITDWFTLQLDRDYIRQMAYEEIECRWNPNSQIKTFKNIIK